MWTKDREREGEKPLGLFIFNGPFDMQKILIFDWLFTHLYPYKGVWVCLCFLTQGQENEEANFA